MLLKGRLLQWTSKHLTEPGIHVYIMDANGNQLGYWTRFTETLVLNDTPIIWGDHIKFKEYDRKVGPA